LTTPSATTRAPPAGNSPRVRRRRPIYISPLLGRFVSFFFCYRVGVTARGIPTGKPASSQESGILSLPNFLIFATTLR
jgi:hypothetical protein